MNAFQRTYKRFIIIFVVVLVVAGGFLLFYGVIRVLTSGPAPTCIDGILNQNEEEVDCGGSCEACLLKTVDPVNVIGANVITTLPGFADVVVWLENPNLHAGAARLSFEVSLNDSAGVITKVRDEQFLLPGQTQFFVYQKVSVLRPPQSGEVEILGVEWQAFERQPQVTLEIHSDILLRPEQNDAIDWQLGGVVRNASSFDLDVVTVVTVLRNASGDVIAAGSHEVRTLRSGEDRAFIISWPQGSDLSAVSAQTRAITNIFSNENILLEYGAGDRQPFQL